MSACVKVNHVPHAYIHNTQKTLVYFLVSRLIENLDFNDTIFSDSSAVRLVSIECKIAWQQLLYAQVEGFVPVRIQCVLYHTSNARLFAVHGSNRKYVGEGW